jgi:hypothetical protein
LAGIAGGGGIRWPPKVYATVTIRQDAQSDPRCCHEVRDCSTPIVLPSTDAAAWPVALEGRADHGAVPPAEIRTIGDVPNRNLRKVSSQSMSVGLAL